MHEPEPFDVPVVVCKALLGAVYALAIAGILTLAVIAL